uniref:Uncharacterized protein n=1 Tax=Ochrobactrum phage ORM_20 TaxID=2985243 RepID=A0A9N6WV34_9VIRU|nr:hypothetical protein ORM20_00192 [Ochrobactrum phage ORM_20]
MSNWDDDTYYPKSHPIPTKPVGKTLAIYCDLHGLNKVDVIQQYSMRSYQTGLYDILTDGNVNSMSKILFDLVTYSKVNLKRRIERIGITVPYANSVKGGKESQEKLKNRLQLVTGVDVFVEELEYAANARENRDVLDQLALFEDSLNISYFRHTDQSPSHYVFICPGSPRKENPLYDMSEFGYFEDSITAADMTFFYNANQAIFNEGRRCFEASSVTFEINRVREVEAPLPMFHFYFPYRLTDKDYMFEEFLHDLPQGTVVAVTDPNESLGQLKPLDTVQSTVNFGVTLLKMDPSKHLDVVRSIILENEQFRKKNPSKGFTCPRKIVMTSKLNHTLHMGPVEMYSIAYPKNHTGEKLDHFKFVRGGTNSFFFEEESKRALGRT